MLNAQIYQQPDIGECLLAEMYEIYVRYYAACEWERFVNDFREKRYVFIIRHNQELCGFSTLTSLNSKDYPDVKVLFSGDTVISHEHWGHQVLVKEFCRFAGKLQARFKSDYIYWFLISKGHRTYRYLRVFSKAFYPDQSTFQNQRDFELHQGLLQHFATLRFGSAYNKERNILTFHNSLGHLKSEWDLSNQNRMEHASILDFTQRNPGYQIGDELCCLTRLCADNLRSHAKRAFLMGLQDLGWDADVEIL
jgi:hypothetical protein